MNIGDKVRFLNEVGGGVVVKIINANTVSVRRDDGFEIPTPVRECIVVKPSQPAVKPTANGDIENTNPTFHHRIPIQIRFNDVDRYGHVNNNSYFPYYDLGKDDYLRKVLQSEYRAGDVVPVIANINADFFIPVLYGDSIVVETAIVKLGKRSFTLLQQAVNTKTEQVVCRCSTVMVCFSIKEQRSADMPEEFRRRIMAFEGLEEK